MQLFEYEECEKLKGTSLYQNRLREIKQWLESVENKTSTIAVLLDCSVYDPLKIIKIWKFKTSSLQVNILPVIHPEQPKPLKWVILDTNLIIDEQILELLVVISIYEIQKWRNGDDRYGISVCLWSKNTKVLSKDFISSYTKLGRINLPTDKGSKYKKHYLRYWDPRVFIHLKDILNSSQYLLYRYNLMPCMYMQHNLVWKLDQDIVVAPTSNEKLFIEKFENNTVNSRLNINPTQRDELRAVGLINQCLVLGYKLKDELVNPDILNSNEVIESVKKYINISVTQDVKDSKDQYIWVLLSLTVHPNFYKNEKVKIATTNKGFSFTEQMQTIDNKEWEVIKKTEYA